MNPLQRMRRAIDEQKYRISSHANEEMAEDDLMAADIEHIIQTGKIAQGLPKTGVAGDMPFLEIPLMVVKHTLCAVFCYQVCY